MSSASVVHLLAAQESVIERHRYRTYPSVCGEVISAVTLPSGGDDEVVYCLGCLHAVIERNVEAGIDQDCPKCEGGMSGEPS